MSIRFGRLARLIRCAVVFVTCFAAAAVHGTDCTSGVSVPGSVTLIGDYTSTSASNTCLTITAANATLDCNGHSLTCNNAAGCGGGIYTEQTGVTIKNCRLLSGTGNWGLAIANGTAATTHIFNNYIENPSVGITLGKTIEKNVIKNASGQCISSIIWAYPTASEVSQNYCSSTDDGFIMNGPSSGTAMNVHDNYIRSADVGILQGGLTEFTQNIIDAATPFSITNGAGASFADNMCGNATYCNDPSDAPFGLSTTFH